MVPYYIFGLVSVAIFGVMVASDLLSESTGLLCKSLKQIMVCGRPETYAPLWFLPSLFFIQLLWYPVKLAGNKRLLVLPIVLLWPYLISKCTLLPWTVTFYLVPFALGYVFRLHFYRAYQLAMWPRIGLVLMSAVLLYISCWVYSDPASYGAAILIPIREVFAILSTMGFAIAIDNRWLSWLGRGEMTLGILLLHKYPIVLMQKMPMVKEICSTEFGVLIIVLLMTACATILSLIGTLAIQRKAAWMFGRFS